MLENNKKLHVVTSVFINIILVSIVFSCDNPLIILAIFLFAVGTLIMCSCKSKIINGLFMFVPFAIMTTLINMLFAWEGNFVLFTVLGKPFTLEALIYAVILAFKLLLIVYIFMLMEAMIDSDAAVSYFSMKLPKSTLLMMISLKLFPVMKERLERLKEIYEIRGVDFEGKGIKKKISSYIPILSILLENSLEDSFDIGEAAYVRGFLSRKRTIYERFVLEIKDVILIAESCVLVIFYIIVTVNGKLSFEIYNGFSNVKVINPSSSIIICIIFIIFITYRTKN